MKTSAIKVHDMLSVLNVDEVEKRIGEVPGVESVTVNFAAGKATVRYDETQIEATDIKLAVRQRGHDTATPAGAAPDEGHAGHAAPPDKVVPATTPDAPPADDAQPDHAAAEKS